MSIQSVLRYAENAYGTIPEYLWLKYPEYAVLRNSLSKKWYAVAMSVPGSRLGLDGDGVIEILNVKCDPLMIDIMINEHGFMRGYHMNKATWLTIFLDGSVEEERIFDFLDRSYELTGIKKKSKG